MTAAGSLHPQPQGAARRSPPALHLEKGSFRVILLLAVVIALSGNSLRRKTEAVKDISLMGFVL